MLSPLTGLVDAARPDSDAARRFAGEVDALLSDAPRFETYSREIENTLNEWHNAGPELEALIDGSPALAEARPLAGDLSQIGTIGLEALSYMTKGVAPNSEWRSARLHSPDESANSKVAGPFLLTRNDHACDDSTP